MGMKPRDKPIDLGDYNRCVCCGDTTKGDSFNRLARLCQGCEEGDCPSEYLADIEEELCILEQEYEEKRKKLLDKHEAVKTAVNKLDNWRTTA